VDHFLAPLAIAAFIAIGGGSVMQLWNWLLPALFGWRHITFWQALDCWLFAGFCSEALAAMASIAPVSGGEWPSAGSG